MFFTKKVTKENISEVSHLIMPFFQSRLSEGLNQSICYALYCIDTPVGVIYGEEDKVIDKFVIKQLRLTAKFKGRKLEKLLLDEIESIMADKKEKEIVFSYLVNEGESEDYTMNLLKENGWQEPNFLGYLFDINNEVLNWKWLYLLPLAKGMKTYKWNKLPVEFIDKFVIEQKTKRSFPGYILQYLSDNKFSHERSAALVIDEEIIGWMFVEEAYSNTFIYRWSHVEKQFRRTGTSIANLFKETVSDVELPSEFSFVFMVMEDNQKMYYFLNRKWRPYISSLCKEYHSNKEL